MRLAPGLLLLASCQQVFGLDPPDHLASDAPVSGRVNGSLAIHHLQNDAAGMPQVVPTVYAPNDVALHVTQNGVTTPVDLLPDGNFSFERTAAAYSLNVRGIYDTTYALSADHPIIVDRVAGRLDATPPSQDTKLLMTFTNRPAARTEFIASSGVYSATGLANGANTMNWHDGFFYGAAGLLDASKHDRLYYYAYTPSGSALELTEFAQTSATLLDGQTNLVSFDVMAPVKDKCASVMLPLATELERVKNLIPPGYTASGGGLAVRAVPTHEISIAYTSFLDSFTAPQDGVRQFTFANPLPGTTMQIMMSVSFSYTVGGVTVGDASAVYLPLTSCPATSSAPAGAVAVPRAIALNGIPLQEGLVVGVSDRVELTWSISSERADYYYVTIYGISSGALTLAANFVTTDTKLAVDPQVFQPGRAYTVNVTTVVGFPNAAIGDFATYEDTHAIASIYSPSFSVVQPN